MDAVPLPEGDFDTWWLSDGLDHAGRADLAARLAERGTLSVYETPSNPMAFLPASFEGGVVTVPVRRLSPGP